MLRRIVSLALVGLLPLALAAPASAAGAHGGGFQGGFHSGGIHGNGFHGSGFHHRGLRRFDCCVGSAFSGGVCLSAYPYPYPVYDEPTYVPAPVYQEEPTAAAPPAQPEVCYVGGCYHLRGDGVSTPYQWMWVPNPPAMPPAPPNG